MSAQPEARPSLPKETAGDAEKYYAKARKDVNHGEKVTYETNDQPKVNGSGLHELRPDYAISVILKGDESDRSNISKLSQALIKQGVYVQIRQGNPGKLLVLAKCSSTRLNTHWERSKRNEWLLGIRTENPDDNEAHHSSEEKKDALSPAERLRLVYDIITSRDSAAIVPGLGEWSFVESIFPLHNYELNKNLVKKWSTQWLVTDKDIDTLRGQFGDKIGLYFAFVQFYFRWSLFPSLVGLITHFTFGSYSVFFAVLNGLWSIAFTEGWKRREAQLAIRWNIKGCSAVESRRLQFVGEKDIKDTVTDEVRPYYSNSKRNMKKLSFVPISLIAGLGLVIFQCFVFSLEIFLTHIYDGPFKSIVALVPTGALIVGVAILTIAYSYVVQVFTNWENHETTESHEASSTSKQFVFNFLTAFVPLLLTSYVYLPFGHYVVRHLDIIRSHVEFYSGERVPTAEQFELNGWRLHQQVIYFVGTAQIVNFAMQNILPYVKQYIMSRTKKYTTGELVFSDSPEEAEFLKQVRDQADLPDYDVQEDYRQLVIQFGYGVLFGPVWALSPIPSSINNWVQLRGDTAKICMETKRPIPHRTESAGPWVNSMSFLSWLGSLTCASIITMFGKPLSGSVFEQQGEKSVVASSLWTLLAVVLLSENAYLLAKRVILFLSNSAEAKESLQDRRRRFQVRKRYLDAADEAREAREAASSGVRSSHGLDPAENEWASVTTEQFNSQIEDALVGPKSLKDKKKE